jgi:chromosome segregation ATPase
MKSMLAMLLVAALLSFAPTYFAKANDSKSGQTLAEQVSQLETDVASLTALVKSLTTQLQQVQNSSSGDMADFQPRLLTVEKLSKENAFDVRTLSGTIAPLVAKIKDLSQLPGVVYQLQDTIRQLNDQFADAAKTFDGKIQSDELLIQNLQDTTEKTMVILDNLGKNFDPIANRMNKGEQGISDLQGQVTGLNAGFQQVSTNASQAQSTLSGNVKSIQSQIDQIQAALSKTDQISQTISSIQVNITEITTRTQSSETKQNEMVDFLDKLAGYEKQTGSLKDQLDQASAQLLIMARQSDENSSIAKDTSSKLDALQAQLVGQTKPGGATPSSADLDKLNQQIASAFEQFQGTQQALAQLQQSLAAAKDEIKSSVMSSLPKLPTSDQIVAMVQQQAAQQLQEAQQKADAAQSMAIIALLVGIGGITIALLL